MSAALPGATPRLLASVLERAAGSPLYAEQLAAMLREQTGSAPGRARRVRDPGERPRAPDGAIDALPPDLKPVLLDASVIGRTFWSGAVATLGARDPATLDPALTDLSRRELGPTRLPDLDGGRGRVRVLARARS